MKKILCLVLALTMVFALASFASAEITLKLSEVHTADYPTGLADQEFARLVEEKTEVILRRLREGQLDAGILALPLNDDQLHIEPLFDEPFVLAVPESHPFAKRKTLKTDELATESLLLLEDGHCLRDQALDVCQLAGAVEKPGFRATSLETLRQMVAANVGITLLPTLAIKPPIPRLDAIHLLRFDGEAPHRQIAMVWRRSSAMGDMLQALAEEFRTLPPGLLSLDDSLGSTAS